jgi:hypothetical protein
MRPKVSRRPRDPRHSAQLTGRKPLRYDHDRHGDLVFFDSDDEAPSSIQRRDLGKL